MSAAPQRQFNMQLQPNYAAALDARTSGYSVSDRPPTSSRYVGLLRYEEASKRFYVLDALGKFLEAPVTLAAFYKIQNIMYGAQGRLLTASDLERAPLLDDEVESAQDRLDRNEYDLSYDARMLRLEDLLTVASATVGTSDVTTNLSTRFNDIQKAVGLSYNNIASIDDRLKALKDGIDQIQAWSVYRRYTFAESVQYTVIWQLQIIGDGNYELMHQLRPLVYMLWSVFAVNIRIGFQWYNANSSYSIHLKLNRLENEMAEYASTAESIVVPDVDASTTIDVNLGGLQTLVTTYNSAYASFNAVFPFVVLESAPDPYDTARPWHNYFPPIYEPPLYPGHPDNSVLSDRVGVKLTLISVYNRLFPNRPLQFALITGVPINDAAKFYREKIYVRRQPVYHQGLTWVQRANRTNVCNMKYASRNNYFEYEQYLEFPRPGKYEITFNVDIQPYGSWRHIYSSVCMLKYSSLDKTSFVLVPGSEAYGQPWDGHNYEKIIGPLSYAVQLRSQFVIDVWYPATDRYKPHIDSMDARLNLWTITVRKLSDVSNAYTIADQNGLTFDDVF